MEDQKALYRTLDDILWLDWDPIGVNEYGEARDEYYSYLPEVFRLKIENAEKETIAQYLYRIETQNMGLFGNIENCRRVADKIIEVEV